VTRKAVILVAAFVLVAVVAVAVVATRNGDTESQPSAFIPPKDRWFGFSGGNFTWTGRHPELDQGLTPERTADDALAAGANSARIDVSWADYEPQPGRVDAEYVGRLDAFFRRLARGGARPVLILGSTPPWASQRPGDPGAPPRAGATRAFARYARSVAQRWPRALAIETWNEPNGRFAWTTGPDPARYAALHRAAARAIRSAAPDVRILVGGLIVQSQDTPEVMRPGRFLGGMYASGLRPVDYDGLALHPYPDGSGELDPRGWAEFRSGHRRADPNAALYVTETGITTSGPDGVSPEEQASQLPDLLRSVYEQPNVRGVWLHTQYDLESAPASDREHGFGVLRSNGAAPSDPKPAYCVLDSAPCGS
jgi:hypothetical protein